MKNQENAFEKVRFKGIGTIRVLDGVKTLCVINTVSEAISVGIDEKEAEEMFASRGYDPCNEEFYKNGTVECTGDANCAPKTCQLHRWDPLTKSWVNHGEGSAPFGTLIWDCKCK